MYFRLFNTLPEEDLSAHVSPLVLESRKEYCDFCLETYEDIFNLDASIENEDKEPVLAVLQLIVRDASRRRKRSNSALIINSLRAMAPYIGAFSIKEITDVSTISAFYR